MVRHAIEMFRHTILKAWSASSSRIIVQGWSPLQPPLLEVFARRARVAEEENRARQTSLKILGGANASPFTTNLGEATHPGGHTAVAEATRGLEAAVSDDAGGSDAESWVYCSEHNTEWP